MLPDEMEAEKNRKIIISQADEIEMLKHNIAEQTQQIYTLYKRIAELTSTNRESDQTSHELH